MQNVTLTPPSGTRDFFGAEVKFREGAVATIKRVFELFGFQPLETPAFERIEVLAGKYGDDEKLIFKILKRGEQAATGEADLALRYDFTVPLARYVAHAGPQPGDTFKRYQIGPVWRADRPAKGRFREFFQCDVDIVGSESRLADVETILAVAEALHALGLDGFVIRLNSRNILKGLMEIYEVPPEREKDVITSLDKIYKIGFAGVAAEFAERGIPPAVTNKLVEDFNTDAPRERVRQRLQGSEVGRRGWREVTEIEELVGARLQGGRIVFDPYIARGLDYYTGAVFEVFYEKDPTKLPLSIASGGRYDDLVGMFMNRPVPACGGSLGFERILLLLEDHGKQVATIPQVLVAVWDEGARADALHLVADLRAGGVSTEVSLREGKLGSQIRSADKKSIPLCVFRGPDEKDRNEVAVKNLRSGEQKTVAADTLVDAVRRELAALNALGGS